MSVGRKPEPLVAAVLLLGAVLAAAAAILALTGATRWPLAAVVVAGSVFGALFGVASWGVAAGRSALAGRVAVAVVLGAVAGELAAVSVFGGAVDAVLAGRVSTSPAVVAAADELAQARAARAGLDAAVTRAGQRRDDALVVARCEFNPSPGCPPIRITGVPGAGPETRTANDFLTDAQRELATATAERDGRAPAADAAVVAREQALTQARAAALDAGLGARWGAMNTHTLHDAGALVLRVLVDGFFVLLSVLPLALRRWRGATRSERAELDAETAIAVKRAEVRAQVEQLWAEQQLTSARLAIEAQNEIDREQQRRRVAEALEEPVLEPARPVHVEAQRIEPVDADRGLPALTRAVAEAPVRWIRPFVPPIVAGAIDNVTKPLRQVFEETEEFHFSIKRTHRVTVESDGEPPQQLVEPVQMTSGRIVSRRGAALSGDAHDELDGAPAPRQLPSGE